MTAIVRQMAAETGAEAFVRQLQAIMSRPDSRPLLASIRCPTLVLVGDGDEATPPELDKEIADGIAGARLVVVPDCGHLSTIEQPEAVNTALAEWLGETMVNRGVPRVGGHEHDERYATPPASSRRRR